MAVVTIDASAIAAGGSGGTAWEAKSTFAVQRIKESSTTTGTFTNMGDVTGRTRQAESFPAGGSGWSVKAVRLGLRKVGAPTDNLTVTICADSSGAPGTVLGTSDILLGSRLDATIWDYWEFNFSTPVALSASTTYWLVLNRSGAVSAVNYYQHAANAGGNPYGSGSRSEYNGTSWTNQPNDDLAFFVQSTEIDWYQLTQDANMHIWKSTDTGATWTEQDSAHTWAVNSSTKSFSGGYWFGANPSSGQPEHFIGVVYFSGTNTARVRQFNIATGLWETADLGTADATTGASFAQNIRVTIRGNEQTVFFISSADDIDVGFTRRTTSTWLANITGIKANNDVNAANILDVIDVLGRSPFSTVLYYDIPNGDLSLKTLTGTTGGSEIDVDTTAADLVTEYIVGNYLWSHDGSGNTRVTILFGDSDGTLEETALTNIGVTSASLTLGTQHQVSASTSYAGRHSASCYFGNDRYAVVSTATTIDYFVDAGNTGTWGSVQSYKTGLTTCAVVSVTPYATGVLIVYMDGGNVKCDVVDLSPAAITISGVLATGTAASSNPTPRLVPIATLSTGSALENPPTLLAVPKPPVAAGSGLLSNPTPTIQPVVTLSTGSVLSSSPVPLISVLDVLAAASALASNPTLLDLISIPTANASAVHFAATIPTLIDYQEFTFMRGRVWPWIKGTSATKRFDLGPVKAILPSSVTEALQISGVLATASALMYAPTPRLYVWTMPVMPVGGRMFTGSYWPDPAFADLTNPLYYFHAAQDTLSNVGGAARWTHNTGSGSGWPYVFMTHNGWATTTGTTRWTLDVRANRTVAVEFEHFSSGGTGSSDYVDDTSVTLTTSYQTLTFDFTKPGGWPVFDMWMNTAVPGDYIEITNFTETIVGDAPPKIIETAQIPLATSSALFSLSAPRISVLDTLAAISGATFNPAFLIGPNTFVVPVMTGSALAFAPSLIDRILATLSSASTAMSTPNLLISVLDTLASVSGVSLNPAFLIGPSTFVVPLSTGSGLMQPPTLRAIALVPLATGSGATGTPIVLLTLSPPVGSASASLPVPAFLIGPNTFVVPLMGASGLVPLPLIRITVNNPLAAISGSALNPSALLAVLDTLATASAQSLNPAFLIGPNTFAITLSPASALFQSPTPRLTTQVPVSAASATSLTPSLLLRIAETLAAATGQTFDPAFLIGPNTLVVPLSPASGLFSTPVIREIAQVPVSIGNGASLNPSILLSVVDTLATATGQAFAPAFLIGPNTIAVPLMTVGSSGATPTIKAIVQVSVSAAALAMQNPTIRLLVADTLATVAGLSFDPIVAVQDQPILLDVSLATVNGVHFVPVVTILGHVTLSIGNAVTFDPTGRITAQIPRPNTNAQAVDPAFLIGPNSVIAPVATGSGLLSPPTPVLTAQIPRLESTGASNNPLLRLTVPAPVSGSGGEFFNPSTQEGATVVLVPTGSSGVNSYPSLVRSVVKATLSTATADALNPTIRLTIPSSLLAAAGFFPAPDVTVVVDEPITIDVPVSSATAGFLTPGIRTSVAVTLSTASIAGADPVPVIEVHAPIADVDAASGAPILRSIVLIPQILGSGVGINPSTVTMIPTPASDALVSFLDPRLSASVLVDRMDAIGTFLEPFLSAEHPWAMQFVALARTLIVEATERNLDVTAGLRTLDLLAQERETESIANERSVTFTALEIE